MAERTSVLAQELGASGARRATFLDAQVEGDVAHDRLSLRRHSLFGRDPCLQEAIVRLETLQREPAAAWLR